MIPSVATDAPSERVRESTGSRAVRRRRWHQQTLPIDTTPRTWGGRRPGAGRKRLSPRPNVAHRARPRHLAGHPVHVTLRSLFRPLRSQHVFPTVAIAVGTAARRRPEAFRVLHFSVQWDHVHLVVEASDERALSSGIQSIAIRIARYVNQLVTRRGRFWADRWHGRALTSPRAVRNALVYVLANFRKHARERLAPGIDAFSSAVRFDGWCVTHGPLPRAGPALHVAMARWVIVSTARTWLGRSGWKRAGLVRTDETPSRRASEMARRES
jgi:putative transposase